MGYGFRGRALYCIQDTAAATQNILLTAYSLGLGACWIGAFNEDEAKEALNAPEGIRPVAIIPVGYANEVPSQRDRRPLSRIMHQESFWNHGFLREKYKSVTPIPIWLPEAWRHMGIKWLPCQRIIKGGDWNCYQEIVMVALRWKSAANAITSSRKATKSTVLTERLI